MKKFIYVLIMGLFLGASYSQEKMIPSEKNLDHFTSPIVVQSNELTVFSSARQHPEYGILPFNAPCEDCIEIIEERTQFTRKFLTTGKNGKEFKVQKGYGPLHYMDDQGRWITYDPRLKKLDSGIFGVTNPFYTIRINTVKGYLEFENKNENFLPIRFHKDLVLETIDGDLNPLNSFKANWTNITAGDDGLKVIDIFPNTDLEINIMGPTIKTNFIVKSSIGSDFRIVETLDQTTLQRIENSNESMEVINFYENNQLSYSFGEISIYDAHTGRDRPKGTYTLKNNLLIYSWDQNTIEQLDFPFIIDPTVTSSNTLPQASITGSGLNNFGAFTTGCTYNLSVPTPANCTITDIAWTFSYIAQNGATMSEGAVRFYYGGCVSPSAAGFYWFCNNTLFGGTCNGNNVSIFTDFSPCVPAPQCAPYNMNFTMEFYDAWGGASCSSTWIAAASGWTMTITGETVTEPAPPTSSAGTSICPGSTTTLNANGSYGVPPYNYSWSPTTGLNNPNIQSPTLSAPAPGPYTYTCTITDACGITATNSINITVVNGAWAGTDGTLDICDNAAPVNLTLSLGGGPDAGGSWSPALNSGGNTFDPSVDGSGTYTYTVPDPPGMPNCPDASADVVVNVIPVSTAGNDGNSTLCNSAGSTLNLNTLLSGADPGGTWAETTSSGQFNTGTGVFNAAGLTAGTYTFTYSFAAVGSCPGDFATFNIVVNDQPTAGNDGNSTICNSAGSTINLNTLLSGADPGGTWAETTSSGQFNTGTGVFNGAGLTAGTYSFTYTVPATAPCVPDVANFDIVVNDQPTAGNDGNSTICNSVGSTIDLNTLLSGADPGGAWAETTSSGQFNTGTGVFNGAGLTAGTYSFTYTVPATAPCLPDVATFDIIVNDQPDAGLDGNSTICNSAGSSIDLNTLLSGADPGGTWAETTASGQFTPGTGVLDASGLTAGVYSFTYTLTATAPCLDDVATFDITITAQPEAGLDGNSTLCNSAGSTIDLNTLLSGADAGGTWAETTASGQFTPGTGVFNASGLTAGNYTFTYSFAASGSCLADFATFDVVVNDQPDAGLDGNSTICNSAGSSIDLNTLLSGADPGGTWAETTASGQFTPGTGVLDASGLTAGVYSFTYTLTATAPCLDDVATFNITITAQPEAGLDGNSTLCNSAGSTIDLNTLLSGADAGGTWAETTASGQFTPGTGVFNAAGLTGGTYTFTYSFAASGSCLADFATFDIVVNDQPDAGLDGNSTICNSAGSSIDLNTLLSGADPGGTWAETTASGQFTPGTGVLDASGLTAGVYSFTYTLTATAPCLDDVATFDITITAQPEAGLDGNSTLCNSAGSTIDLNTLLSGADAGGTWAETTASGQFTPGTGVFNAAGLTGGTYTFTYSFAASGSCLADFATFDIVVNDQPDAGLDGNSTICNSAGSTLDLNTLLSGADAGGTWAETTASGQFTPGTGVFDASGLASGTYSFTYTIIGSAPCLDDVANFDVVVNQMPNAGGNGNSTLCNSTGSTIDLNTLLSGADPGGTWAETTASGQFTPGTGTFDASGLTAGTYSFTYTVSGTAPCLDDVANFDIVVNQEANAGANGNSTLCNSAGSTLDLNTLLSGADAGGTWAETTASGQFTPGSGVFDASGLTSGTYSFTYTVTGTAPCLDDVANFDVTVTDLVDAGNDNNTTICDNNGAFDVSTLLDPGVTAGGAWSETSGSPSGQFTAGTSSLDPTGLNGTFTFLYSIPGSGSCLGDDATMTVTVNSLPNAGLDGNSSICNSAGSTIDLNTLLSGADAGGTWMETTASGQFNTGTGVFDASGLTIGTYTFTYTVIGTAPCVDDVATFDITVTGQPVAGGDGNSTLCNSAGSTLDLNTLLSGADPGGTWAETTSSGQFTAGTGVFDASSLSAGTYSFTYSFAASGSCLADVANFDVVVNNQPNAGLDGNTTLCNSAGTTLDLNTLLSGADAGGTWAETTSSGQFNTGTGVLDASGLAAGTYTFTYTVTATAPCVDAVATFDVSISNQPNAGTDASSTICNSAGSTLDLNTLLSGADAGGTWAETTSSGQFTAGTGVFDASGLTAGTYSFTYTLIATAPCVDDMATFDITVTGSVTAGADNSATICSDNGVFDVSSLLDATANAGGTWTETSGTPSGQFTAGSATLDPSGLNGTFTFDYTLAGSGTCLGDNATMTITINPVVNAGADGNSSLCNTAGSTLDLNTLLSGADPGGTWAETTSSGQFNTGTGVFDASNLGAGTYTFTYTLTATAPCVDDVATFTVNVVEQPNAGANAVDTLCNTGATINLNTLLSGADPGGTWTETTSSGQFNASTGIFDANGLAGGNYVFEYTIAGAGSCPSSTSTFTITVTAAPAAPTLIGGGTFCENSNITLTANGSGGTITWYTDPNLNNVFQTGPNATFTVPLGTNTFYVVEDNGCQGAVGIISVTGIPGPTLDVPPVITACVGDFVTITGSSNATILWSTGDTTATISFTATTDTFVVATVITNCDTLIDTVQISVFPPFDVDAGPDQTVPAGAVTTIEATSASAISSVSWTPGTFLDCSTCAITDVAPTQDVTYIVNAMDENGCTASDTITIFVDGEITVYIPNIFSPNGDGQNDMFGPLGPSFSNFKMEIYNRWGGLVWSTEEPNVKWPGTTMKGEPCPQAVFIYKIWGKFYTGQIFERSGNVMLTR